MSIHINVAEGNGFVCRRIDSAQRRRLETKFGKMVRISRKDYRLIYCQGLSNGRESLAGLCIPDEHCIYVNIEYEPIEETLVHEILHAEFCESGLQQMEAWNNDLEENIVEIVSKSLTHLFCFRRRV